MVNETRESFLLPSVMMFNAACILSTWGHCRPSHLDVGYGGLGLLPVRADDVSVGFVTKRARMQKDGCLICSEKMLKYLFGTFLPSS